MAGLSNPRRANGTRRTALRRRVLAEETHCWLCGQPVDRSLPTGYDGSPEIDEVLPVSLGGSPYDRANCRLAHRWCNRHRGNGPAPDEASSPAPLVTARSWSVD